MKLEPEREEGIIQMDGLIVDLNMAGAVLRWQRNRTGKPLSPPKFIKRTFER